MIMGGFPLPLAWGIGSAGWLPGLSQAMAVCGRGVVCSAAEKWWGSRFGGQCLKAGRAVGTNLGDQSCYFSCQLGPEENTMPRTSQLKSCTERS